MQPRAYIHAADGIGPNATPLAAFDHAAPLRADAVPVDLRQTADARRMAMPRLASRLAQLAVTGARLCASRLASPLMPGTPVYLATGLGDVARTDALYYQVMPPLSEMASPAQFATSGNNMPAFFVAQQLGLRSRNFTISQQDLSFEYALQLALDDMAAGIATTSLVGGVDETTVPRAFYVRRYPLSADRWIGEGSAWLVLGTAQTGAIGEVAAVSVGAMQDDTEPGTWARRTAAVVEQVIDGDALAVLMPGGRVSAARSAALGRCLPQLPLVDYRGVAGCTPVAAALAMAGSFACAPRAGSAFVHVNCDTRGRTALIAWRRY